MAKPIRALEFHYPMSQFLIIIYYCHLLLLITGPLISCDGVISHIWPQIASDYTV